MNKVMAILVAACLAGCASGGTTPKSTASSSAKKSAHCGLYIGGYGACIGSCVVPGSAGMCGQICTPGSATEPPTCNPVPGCDAGLEGARMAEYSACQSRCNSIPVECR